MIAKKQWLCFLSNYSINLVNVKNQLNFPWGIKSRYLNYCKSLVCSKDNIKTPSPIGWFVLCYIEESVCLGPQYINQLRSMPNERTKNQISIRIDSKYNRYQLWCWFEWRYLKLKRKKKKNNFWCPPPHSFCFFLIFLSTLLIQYSSLVRSETSAPFFPEDWFSYDEPREGCLTGFEPGALTTELRRTLLSYAAHYWATPHPNELCRTVLKYAAPYGATSHPTELCRILLSNAAPYWAMPHPIEQCRTLLSYAASYWPMPHHTELCRILLSNATPYWAMPHPIEQCRTLLSYAAPYWAMPDPIEQCHTLQSYAAPDDICFLFYFLLFLFYFMIFSFEIPFSLQA